MTKFFTVYDSSGKILRSGSCPEYDYENQNLPGELILEGLSDAATQYVDNGIIVDMPERPSDDYDFDYVSKSWIYNEQLASKKARGHRNYLLVTEVDSINAIRWLAMNQQEQEQWTKYRQDLLDITTQPNFPHDIIWPIKPGTGE